MLKSPNDAEIDKESIFRSPNLTGRLTYKFFGILGLLRFVLHPINRHLSLEENGCLVLEK
jgi:hypothetical protein